MIPRVTEANLKNAGIFLDKYGKTIKREVVRDLNIETLDVIPMDLPPINYALGCGGFPRGRLIELVGPPSSGKCVSGETFIPVEGRGIMRLEEIALETGVTSSSTPDSHQESIYEVKSDLGGVDTTHLYYAGDLPTMGVETEHGHFLKGLDDHRILSFGLRPEEAAVEPKGSFRGGQSRWVRLRGAKPGDILLTSYGFGVFGDQPIRLPVGCGLPTVIDTPEGAAFLGGLCGVEPRADNWALTSTSPGSQRAFRAWGGSLGLHDLVEEIPTWTRVTGLTRLACHVRGLVGLAVSSPVLASLRQARLSLQAAWLAGVVLQKGRWSHHDLEVELWSEEAARTFQAISENLGVRWILYWTLHPHQEDGRRYKLALRGRLDQQTMEEKILKNFKTPSAWRKQWTRDEDENYPGVEATLRGVQEICRREGRDNLARIIEPEDVSKEHCECVLDMISGVPCHNSDEPLIHTLTVMASPWVSWDRVVAVNRFPRTPCWDFRVPLGSRLSTNSFLSHNSTLALSVCKSELNINPGGFCFYMDFEGSLTSKYVGLMGLTEQHRKGRFKVADLHSIDEAEHVIGGLFHKDVAAPPSVIVVDSVAAMKTKNSLEGNYDEGGIGEEARAYAKIAPKWTHLASTYGTTFILINQLRSKIYIDQYAAKGALRIPGLHGAENEQSAGGRAWKFFISMSIRLDVKKFMTREVKNLTGDIDKEVYAAMVRMLVLKNKADVPMRSASFYIKFGYGIDVEQTLWELGVAAKIIRKEGSWSKMLLPDGREIKFQGDNKFLDFLRSSEEVQREIQRQLSWDQPNVAREVIGYKEYSVGRGQTPEEAAEADYEATQGITLEEVNAHEGLSEKAHVLGIITQDATGWYNWSSSMDNYRQKSLVLLEDSLTADDRTALEVLVEQRVDALEAEAVLKGSPRVVDREDASRALTKEDIAGWFTPPSNGDSE